MAMATKENMEIEACSSLDACHDLDLKRPIQIDTENTQYKNDDDTRRFSAIYSVRQASCSDCDKNDPIVAYCHTCKSSLCTFCYDCHVRQRKYKSHEVVNFEQAATEFTCTEKSNKMSSRIYAGYVQMKEASQLTALEINEMEKQLSKIHDGLNQIIKTLAVQATKANDKIEQLYTERIHNLKQQKEQKIEELHNKALELENINLAKLKYLESIQIQLESFKKSISNTSPPNFVQVTTELAQLSEQYESIMAQPVVPATLEFHTSDVQAISLGEVIFTTNPASSAAKQDTNFQEGTDNANDKIFIHDQVIKGINDGLARPRSNSAFKLSTMRIKLKRNKSDTHIKRPSKRYTKDTLTRQIKCIRWPNRIKTNGGKMGRMCGIGFRNDGIWAAADHSNHCIHVCDANNELIKILGSKGKASNQFIHPTGIAFDNEGCLYITEYGNHRVQKFDANFEFMLQFGEEGEDDGQLTHPMGIAVYKHKVYVADNANSRIAVFYTDGKFCSNIVTGCLRDPYDIAINYKHHQLLVTDSACCIRIYSLEGKYINRFSGFGPDRSLLNHPASLAVDSNGFVFIADTYNHRICIFSNIGMFVCSFGSCGNNEGQFNRPQGIAFSANGTLFVSDHGNQRIMLFPTKFKARLK